MNKRWVIVMLLGFLAASGQNLLGQSVINPAAENPFAGKVILVYVKSPSDKTAESGIDNSKNGNHSKPPAAAGSQGFVLVNARTIKYGNREFLAGTGADTGAERGQWTKDVQIRVAWDAVTVFYLLNIKEAKKRYPSGSFEVHSEEDEPSEEDFTDKVVVPSILQAGQMINCPMVDAKIIEHGGRKFLAGSGPKMDNTPYEWLHNMSVQVAWDLVDWYCVTTPEEYKNRLKMADEERPSPKE
jgi:hypothetical protein